MRTPFEIGGTRVQAGTRQLINLPVPRLYTHANLNLPVQVLHGRRSGPVLFVSAGVHGDELNGIEIIRRLLRLKVLNSLRGTLLAVPVVNVFGILDQTRYLPDRRDLNRSFPGNPKGSLASRLAHLFMQEIVSRCTHGIDLHTGSNHRTNLPQIRACLDSPETEKLAKAFGAPIILDSTRRDGSLRQAVFEHGMPILLYEAGEALRFNEFAIRAGVKGLLGTMRELGMLRPAARTSRRAESIISRSSSWVRASQSGILSLETRLGQKIVRGQKIASISDPLGQSIETINASATGIVIGQLRMPLVYQGDAVIHIAQVGQQDSVTETMDAFEARIDLSLSEFM